MIRICSKDAERDFSSTQIDIPKDIRDKIMAFSKSEIVEDDLYEDPDDPSFGREVDSHITVKYGLHTTESEVVSEIVKDFGPFDVQLGTISRFESEKYDVIIIQVNSSRLHDLNKLIADNTECTDTHPTYKPHCTLAYVQKGCCEDLLDSEYFEGTTFEATEIKFSSKTREESVIKL